MKTMRFAFFFVLLSLFFFSLAFIVACESSNEDDSTSSDSGNPSDDDDDNDDNNDDNDNDNDDNDDSTPEGVPIFSSFVTPPAQSVLPPQIESCAIYQDTQCTKSTLRVCDIYDALNDQWDTDPDKMTEQMYWYDRYFDKYHKMEGQHSDLEFTQGMMPGTPEDVWGDPQYFQEYDGFGDGAGWTGTALQSAAARYAITGTQADYNRMLDNFETMAFLYEATEVPGLLMRSFFAMLEDEAPPPIGHPGKALANYVQPGNWHFRYPMSQEFLDRLPSYFTDGVTILGNHYSVTPLWMGDASRDMYVRSLPGVMLAYDLLGEGTREDALRTVIETEIPCTLKRLKKLRIKNLQSNWIILQAISLYLGTDRLLTEPDDIDLTKLDTLYGYVMEQPNPDYMSAFDPTCPDTMPYEIESNYDIDAGNFFEFFYKFLMIVGRSQRMGAVPITWIQFPSVRGSDALFMTQWALAGHYFSGDENFLVFLEDMMEELEYWEVIDLMGSFYSPKWCFPHFGPSLLYPTLWNLQNRIDKGTYPKYWNKLAGYIYEEMRNKELAQANDLYFGILYDSMVDSSIDSMAHGYALYMVDMLRETSQLGVSDIFEPRRNYPVDLISNPPYGLVTEELTQEDYDLCMQPLKIFGIEIELGSIEDELPRAVEGMPIAWRVPGSFQWQMDPYMLKRLYSGKEGKVQWPMQGFSVSYWTGRLQGLIWEGEDSALGWRDTGEACK